MFIIFQITPLWSRSCVRVWRLCLLPLSCLHFFCLCAQSNTVETQGGSDEREREFVLLVHSLMYSVCISVQGKGRVEGKLQGKEWGAVCSGGSLGTRSETEVMRIPVLTVCCSPTPPLPPATQAHPRWAPPRCLLTGKPPNDENWELVYPPSLHSSPNLLFPFWVLGILSKKICLFLFLFFSPPFFVLPFFIFSKKCCGTKGQQKPQVILL